MDVTAADTLVTGATGLIGRWLVADLTRRGRNVAAVVRGAERRSAELRAFTDAHGGDASRLTLIEGDVTRPGLGIAAPLDGVRDVFHLAAQMQFGQTVERARSVHVDGTLNAVRWCEGRALRRFVYLGGYRATRMPAWVAAQSHPLSSAERRRLYRKLGSYEASKYEAHLAVRALCPELGVPLSIVNPCSVIGDSRSGETTQIAGIGEMALALWRGDLPALAGSSETFVPLISVDYLAAFLATVPEHAATRGEELTVLDDATPNLPQLIAAIGEQLGVRTPRLRIPVALVRALPRAITGVDREALSFVAEDRYDTRSARAHARAAGLELPDLNGALQRWLDFLVASRFLGQAGSVVE